MDYNTDVFCHSLNLNFSSDTLSVPLDVDKSPKSLKAGPVAFCLFNPDPLADVSVWTLLEARKRPCCFNDIFMFLLKIAWLFEKLVLLSFGEANTSDVFKCTKAYIHSKVQVRTEIFMTLYLFLWVPKSNPN